MRPMSRRCGLVVWAFAALACCGLRQAMAQEGANVVLPEGVKAVWDLDRAYRESTPTREADLFSGFEDFVADAGAEGFRTERTEWWEHEGRECFLVTLRKPAA